MKNYYDILEVSEKASQEVIEKAYKALVKKYHPDLQPPENKAKAEEKIKEINEAYEILSDSSKREQYNNKLNIQKAKENLQQNSNNNYTNNTVSHNNINHSPSQNSAVQTSVSNSNSNSTHIKRPTSFQKNNSNSTTVNNAHTNKQAADRAYFDAYHAAYQKAYEDNLRSLGYKIRYKRTFKEHLRSFVAVILTIIFIIILCAILWAIPPVKSYLLDLYYNNELIKLFVDIILNIFDSFVSLFKK